MLDPRFTTQNFFHFGIQKKIMRRKLQNPGDILQFKKNKDDDESSTIFCFSLYRKQIKAKSFYVSTIPLYIQHYFEIKEYFQTKFGEKNK